MEGELTISIRTTINVEDEALQNSLDKLLRTVENVVTDTEEFYTSTARLIMEMLVSSAEKMKEKRKGDPAKDLTDDEIARIKDEVLPVWRDSLVSKGVNKDYTPPYTVHQDFVVH